MLMSNEDFSAGQFLLSRRQLLGSAAVMTGGVMLGAAGCSTATGGSSAASGGAASSSFNYGESGSFSTFNPWAQSLNEQSVANQVFSRLVYKTADGKPVGDLAASWQLAGDGKSMQLKLRDGLEWQDGTKLTAMDFVTMYGYLTDPALNSDAGVQKVKKLFAPVTGVKAPDPTTVVMEFKNPVPYVLDILNFWYAVRFADPKDTNFLTKLPVGTGPFKMTNFVSGQSATFDANPKYHVPDQPKSKSFRYSIFASGANVVSNLQSGQVDGVLVSNDADVKSLEGNADYFTTNVRLGVWLVAVNCTKPPFDKVEVRQALSYSMNRAQFAAVGNFGLEEPVTSPFFAAAATGYDPALVNAQAFDLNKAKSLLEAAGVTNLAINYPSPTSHPNLQAYGEIWQSDLAKIGVKLNIQTVDNARWIDLGSGKDQTIDLVPWQVNRCLQDGAVFFAANSGFRGGAGELSRFGYKNPTLEMLVAQGASVTDTAKRKQIYQQLNKIVVDDAYAISTATFSETWAWSSKLKGQSADLAGNLMLANAKR